MNRRTVIMESRFYETFWEGFSNVDYVHLCDNFAKACV